MTKDERFHAVLNRGLSNEGLEWQRIQDPLRSLLWHRPADVDGVRRGALSNDAKGAFGMVDWQRIFGTCHDVSTILWMINSTHLQWKAYLLT